MGIKFSVITINYNNNNGLHRTIKSVINQKYRNFEFIIIDGGSNDGSYNTITSYSSKINYWVSEKDNGIYHAMNKGVHASNGEYLIFMNSGDEFNDDSVLATVSQKSNGSDILIGDTLCQHKKSYKLVKSPEEITLANMLCGVIRHQSSFIKKELLIKYPYDEKYKIISDVKFFIDAFVWGNCTYQHINYIISKFENSGISNTNIQLCKKENTQLREELALPPRIMRDYYFISKGRTTFQIKLKKIGETTFLGKLLYTFLSILVYIKKIKS